jgi:hypothetical protein
MDIVMKKRGPRGQERPQEKDFAEKRVVRVLPKNDLIRKYIKHQPTGLRFLKEGSVEWPLDQFTRNRLRDGDVIIEPEKPKEDPKQREQDKKKPTSEQQKSKPALASAPKTPEQSPHN